MHDQQHEKMYSHNSNRSTILVRVGIALTSVILIVLKPFPKLENKLFSDRAWKLMFWLYHYHHTLMEV